jgi:hypothetical protein
VRTKRATAHVRFGDKSGKYSLRADVFRFTPGEQIEVTTSRIERVSDNRAMRPVRIGETFGRAKRNSQIVGTNLLPKRLLMGEFGRCVVLLLIITLFGCWIALNAALFATLWFRHRHPGLRVMLFGWVVRSGLHEQLRHRLPLARTRRHDFGPRRL